jgi:hypothetical protein
LENTRGIDGPVKKALNETLREPPQLTGNPASDLLKSLKKGRILHLRDDFRPFMKIRYWVFQDLFVGGGIFLHHEDEGFLEVKKEHIDWQENKSARNPDPNLTNKPKIDFSP